MKQIIRYGLLILFPLLLGVGETEIVVDSGQEAENATWEKSAGAEYGAFSFLWENACGELTLDINHFTSSYKSYIWLAANRKITGRQRWFYACLRSRLLLLFMLIRRLIMYIGSVKLSFSFIFYLFLSEIFFHIL